MNHEEKIQRMMAKYKELDMLEQKSTRTKEEQARYDELRAARDKPMTRAERMVYERICDEALAFEQAKPVD